DGSVVGVQELVQNWRLTEADDDGQLIDSVRAESLRTLTVHLSRSYAGLPARLADLRYAVTRPRTGSPWREGTGPYAIEGRHSEADSSRSVIGIVPSGSGSGPRIEIRLADAAADGRDLLDAGVDVLVTRDSRVLEYATLRPEFIVEPLRWDRVYVLLSPTRVRELRAAESARLPGLPSQRRAALASDAVRGDARGTVGPQWWEGLTSCEHELETLRSLPPAVATAAYRVSDARRVVYMRGDEAARGLAERIVALVRSPARAEQAAALAAAIPGIELPSAQLLAAELDDADHAKALSQGDEYLFVVALPTQPLDRCHELARLAERVPWLDPGRLDPAAAIVPLVETRDRIILRAGTARLQVDWEGTVRVVNLAPPGARRP
ncbi:MAG: hypothetical protein JSU87_04735, partial [Gemmatimonadota bacterium]